jgi:hypothetical protein
MVHATFGGKCLPSIDFVGLAPVFPRRSGHIARPCFGLVPSIGPKSP